MESPLIENKNPEPVRNVSTCSSSNQFNSDLELPDDTFRMNLDDFSVIGENVTIGREVSLDGNTPVTCNPYTPTVELTTPDVETPPPDFTNHHSPSIVTTPKLPVNTPEPRRPATLLQLSLTKKSEDDIFVKPSPVQEVMSPAKMLQFEREATSATPTMKRAVIDFDFFTKNNFEKYFKEDVEKRDEESKDPVDVSMYKETPVIVNADTVRHEIGFGKLD
ncbi:unnamed protein product [Arctia plantaginis]|uniref:Uncharacterized protein n=1 Tax=Arctia plantaginis TaxID=874455 RepID=A0A8S0ZIM6_ARCPL|nr:unnamed protein product [Arctia plantaginis]CAB3247197.1 unnamed protein product [Arctia plantaginis]